MSSSRTAATRAEICKERVQEQTRIAISLWLKRILSCLLGERWNVAFLHLPLCSWLGQDLCSGLSECLQMQPAHPTPHKTTSLFTPCFELVNLTLEAARLHTFSHMGTRDHCTQANRKVQTTDRVFRVAKNHWLPVRNCAHGVGTGRANTLCDSGWELQYDRE